MADEKSRELTLYVQSKKAVTSFYRPPADRVASGGLQMPSATTEIHHAGHSDEDSAGSGQEVYFLSDDQARCLALTEEIASRRGYTVHTVDIAKVGRVERLVTEHLRGVDTLPVLVAPSDRRLEGIAAFTEDRLCEIMPADMSNLRAFTYVKVRGGNLDLIRDSVLAFPQVRELHLLTGDWDVFIVLEFPTGTTKKRQILDFVTEKIRGIPEVLDTSTLVPEFSVTKFPT